MTTRTVKRPSLASIDQQGPPFDLVSERNYLSVVLCMPDFARPFLSTMMPVDFHWAAHRTIYHRMLELHAAGNLPAITLLLPELKKHGELEAVGGEAYLLELVEQEGLASEVKKYASNVREMAYKRRIREAGLDAIVASQNGRTARDIATTFKDRMADVERAFEATPDETAVYVRGSEVATEEVRWLWNGVIPFGKLCYLIGDPGKGKSLLTGYIGARCSRGLSLPGDDRQVRQPSDVIYLAGEDDLADTIKPRFNANGGDDHRLIHLTGVKGKNDTERFFNLQRDIDKLYALLPKLNNPVMLAIDPISMYIGKCDSHNDLEVRQALAPLSEFAATTGLAVLCVAHLNKSEGKSALGRSMGSIAFLAAARAAWLVTPDKTDPTRRLFLQVKNNLAPHKDGRAFRIQGDEHGQPYIDWEEGTITTTADEALAVDRAERPERKERVKPAQEEAAKWLRDLLKDGALLAKDVKKEADAAGVNMGTLRRLSGDTYRATRSSFGGAWYWELIPERAGTEDAHINSAHDGGSAWA